MRLLSISTLFGTSTSLTADYIIKRRVNWYRRNLMW